MQPLEAYEIIFCALINAGKCDRAHLHEPTIKFLRGMEWAAQVLTTELTPRSELF